MSDENELIRRIAKMTRREAIKVAWHVNDPYGGMDIPGMQRPPSGDKHSPSTDLREMDALLKLDYDTTTTDLKSKVADDVKCLIECNTTSIFQRRSARILDGLDALL